MSEIYSLDELMFLLLLIKPQTTEIVLHEVFPICVFHE
jgi:hypothetical protein